MKTVIRRSDNRAIYLFEDNDEVLIRDTGMLARRKANNDSFRAFDVMPDTHRIVENVEAPDIWIGGVLEYNDGWSVAVQDQYDAVIADLDQEARQIALSQVISYGEGIIHYIKSKLIPGEEDSWPTKEVSAKRFLSGNADDEDNLTLSREAARTGEDFTVLATRIATQATGYRLAMSELTGMRRSAQQRMSTATRETAMVIALEEIETTRAALEKIPGFLPANPDDV